MPGLERAELLAGSAYAAGWEEIARLHSHLLAQEPGIGATRAGRLLYRGEEPNHAVVDDASRTVLAVQAKWTRLSKREIPAPAGRN